MLIKYTVRLGAYVNIYDNHLSSTCVFLLTLAKNLKTRPSSAIA